jgi:C-terminal processing protease CtpA/Prc
VDYTLTLPETPQGEFRDVDQDGDEESGVQVFAVAYWENTFGDPFLEERDLYGGGWSGAYASTRASEVAADEGEIVGGVFVVYAPDDEQGFPSGFGDDEKLFTEDDPIVTVPAGWTVVNLDSEPFTFDRSSEPVIDLIEPEGAAVDDFSQMSYTEAFDAMVEKFRLEYSFTELKDMDWNALSDEYRPRVEQAEADEDAVAFALALRDFYYQIPDGHLQFPLLPQTIDLFQEETAGGIGIALGETDDGVIIARYISPAGPAEEAGIALGAEITEIDGTPISDYASAVLPWSSPFSTEHAERLQQLRYATRFVLDAEVDVTYQNPDADAAETVTLIAIEERDSFSITSFNRGLTGVEQPLEYRLLESGYGYVKIYSFFDNALLSIQLWERMIQSFTEAGVTGIIVDMRQNSGGSPFLATQMAAYFFDEVFDISKDAFLDRGTGEFVTDDRGIERFYLPAENLRYRGDVAVLVGPSCGSACEGFSYIMSLQERAAIVGQYPTGGLGGGQDFYLMPDDIQLQMSVTRSQDMDGNNIIEGIGVIPTVDVPVTVESLLSDEDVVLAAGEAWLDGASAVELVDGGEIALDEPITGEIVEAQRVRYTFTAEEDVTVTISLTDAEGALDTYLRIYDTDDNLLAEIDDIEAGVQINSVIEGAQLSAGDVIVIEVGTYDDASAGEYTLEIISE